MLAGSSDRALDPLPMHHLSSHAERVLNQFTRRQLIPISPTDTRVQFNRRLRETGRIRDVSCPQALPLLAVTVDELVLSPTVAATRLSKRRLLPAIVTAGLSERWLLPAIATAGLSERWLPPAIPTAGLSERWLPPAIAATSFGELRVGPGRAWMRTCRKYVDRRNNQRCNQGSGIYRQTRSANHFPPSHAHSWGISPNTWEQILSSLGCLP